MVTLSVFSMAMSLVLVLPVSLVGVPSMVSSSSLEECGCNGSIYTAEGKTIAPYVGTVSVSSSLLGPLVDGCDWYDLMLVPFIWVSMVESVSVA